jgi:NitT/TauT family transport system ATP-binding protein
VLLMDEPFSSLDILTAETLRTDFLDLWTQRQLPTKSVLLVTHNIEEAVMMCDRVLVLASHPGRIAAEIPVSLSHPRNRFDQEFHRIVDEFYSILTARAIESVKAQSRGVVHPLPPIGINRIIGFIEALAAPPYEGQAELGTIAHAPSLLTKDVLALAEVLHILEFAELKDGSIRLTAAGRIFAQVDTEERKRLFKEHLLRFVPFAAHIHRVLEEREDHSAPRIRFKSELEDHLSSNDAERTLQTIIRWGRYAEVFAYDDERRSFNRIHSTT